MSAPSLRAISMLALVMGQVRLALALLIGFHCCLRTGELLNLRIRDINVSKTGGSVALPVTKTSRRKAAAEFVTIEDPQLLKLLHHYLPKFSQDEFLVRETPTQFRLAWRDLLSFFDLDPSFFTPYSLRRGGTTFFFVSTGSLDRTILRGRWQSAKSARIYIEDGRAQLINAQSSAKTTSLTAMFSNLWKSFPVR